MSLTVLIPCYNEHKTILEVLHNVKKNISSNDNIIVIDDGSNDGTTELLHDFSDKQVTILFHEKNKGKGNAIQTGLKSDLKDYILIQDADLEYNPAEYQNLLVPFKETNADIVYGSRFLGGQKYSRIHYFWHYVANKLLTFVTNLFTNLNMSDMETGYNYIQFPYLTYLNS